MKAILTPTLGIDKLEVTTQDFAVKEVNSQLFGIDMRVPEGSSDYELPYLLTDGTGRQVRAKKIYHNGPKERPSLGNYSIDPRGLKVTLNPSKIVHPYHLTEPNSKECFEVLKMLEREMKDIGIQANLLEAKLSRCDYAKQRQMKQPCNQYEAGFRLMKGKRAKERAYDGGYLFHNNSHEFMFYDKRKELEHLKMNNVLGNEQNFMRAEMRLKKGKVISSMMRVSTLGGLHELSPSDLNAVYNHYLTDKVFRKKDEPEQMVIDFQEEVQILKHYRESISRNAWMHYLMDGSFDELLTKFGSIDAFGVALEQAGYKRTQVWSIKEEVRGMMYRKAQFDKVRNEITPSSLIDELYQKFAA